MLKLAYHADGSTHHRHMDGWKRQGADARDHAFSLKLQPHLAALPTIVDNRRICSPITDQGDLGSCTSNAFAALIEANEIKRIGGSHASSLASGGSAVISNFSTDAQGRITFLTTVTPSAPTPAPAPAPTPQPKPPLQRVSRLFEYYATRVIEGTVGVDSGASIRDAIKAGAKYGVANESTWPYDVSKFVVKPPDAVWNAAATHKVVSYHAIADGDIATMKGVLAAQNLIEFGFTVYESFMGQQLASTGVMPMPKPGEQVEGGHAVALVGYEDARQAFLVRNSWGTNWGLAGYFYMPYAFVADVHQCNDFWVVTSAPL